MKAIVLAGFALCAGLGLGGCATVTRGTTTTISVVSEPPGASVKTSNGFACSPTPCGMKVPRKDGFDVTVSKDGFQPVTSHVRAVVSGGGGAGFAGNIVAGGLIGMAVDGSNGSMNDLVPNPVKVTLEPAPAPVVAAANQ